MNQPEESGAVLGHRPGTSEHLSIAWTWFSDQRAIIDESTNQIIVGGVSGGENGGDIVVTWADLSTGVVETRQLHPGLERDDHNGPVFYKRTDGKYLAMYTKHGTDRLVRWRISAPEDPTTWTEERTLDVGAPVTYCNLHQAAGNRLYCFSRAENWDPTLLLSNNKGESWESAGQFLTFGGPNDRPYVRYVSRAGEIHLISTEGHPHRTENGIYHGIITEDSICHSNGSVIGSGITRPESDPIPIQSLTSIFEPNTVINDSLVTRGWTIDVQLDQRGRPVAIFQARVDDNRLDHRYYYATWKEEEWEVSELAKAGGYLYPSEWDYTGLATLDPNNPRRVVISTPIDPRGGEQLASYRLFAGELLENSTWRWAAIGPVDEGDNIRPNLLERDEDAPSVLVWMHGEYTTYTSWETSARFLCDPFSKLY